jgi:hypothetical protein
MIPNNSWIDDTSISDFESYGVVKPDYRSTNIYRLSLGPSELNFGADGLMVRYWLIQVESGTVKAYKFNDNNEAVFDADLFDNGTILELAATFDQLGQPLVFYSTGTGLELWWYDPIAQAYVTANLGEGSSPFATFDIRYDPGDQNSDVILFYVKAGAIYYRLQRDRYTIEYTTPVVSGVNKILAADMTVDYRLQLVYSSI